MTDQVEPRFKGNVGVCGCGCGRQGVLRAKPWRDDTRCVRRGCDCPRCRGRRSKEKGSRRQTAARKALRVPNTSSMAPGHEEHFAGAVRVEVKAGKQVGPVLTRFLRAEVQSEASRPIGDHRPFVAVFMPEGTRDGLVVFRTSALPEVVAALHDQLGEAP